MKKLVHILILFLAASNLYAQAKDYPTGSTQQNGPTVMINSENCQEFNCFAVIAGKAATADGSVLLAHNEDDSGEQMLNIYIVPRKEYNSSSGTAGEAKYLWCEFPGMEVADAFLNEYGVGIVSNSCPSKEDRKDFTDGGVLYEVRTTVAKKARSSREAVKMLGKLVEERGYRGSGRTYSIADPDEAWIFSVVQGRHWVAQRVPDNCVMALPNNYIIDETDLSDTVNFAGSPDIIEYAVERGWYNPQKDGNFSFKRAYCKPSTYISDRNVLRHQSALQFLTGKKYNSNPDSFELFVTPNRKITIEDMIEILASHGENLPPQSRPIEMDKEPNRHPECICVDRTVVSTIFQLNRNTPKELGHIMWVAPGRPCVEPFTPWYTAMEKAPEGWGRFTTAKEAQEKHFSDSKEMRANYPQAKVWEVTERWEWLNEDYNARKDALKKRRNKEQKRIFKEHIKRIKSKK
ncbi:MAG: C69 family dipeptidase [Bacteroidales bacterium]|nr:C69 family dipeptidase [Bacteroidales bacterium]